jgi:hypothetical protein
MHGIGAILITSLVTLGALNGGSYANPDPETICNPKANTCRAIVTTPGHPGEASRESRDKNRSARRSQARAIRSECRTRPAVPQPPKSDPVWKGHRTGRILVHPCWLLVQMDSHRFWAPDAPDAEANASVSPALLARQALAQLRVPQPVIRRSPEGSATVAGVPVTWVNMWTWVWTEPVSWRQVSKKASLGPVWATVTVKPRVLVFEPGLGGASVSCPGPGRAWTPADGNARPTRGGCGYVYRSVSAGVDVSLAIRWAVSWTGSGGAGGQLPVMTTRVSDRFAVEQIQVVNR